MNETIDQLIQARFDAVADQTDDGEWYEVLARARSADRTKRQARDPRTVRHGRTAIRLAVGGAVAVIALVASAAAFGWPGTVVDFFKARPAPQSVRQFFETHNVALPHGLNPDTKLRQPREVMTATFDANNSPPTNPTEHTLYVAPRTDGGFCYLWTEYGGGCADPLDASAATTNPGARPFGVEWLAGDYATFADGYVRGEAQTAQARFADGSNVTVPVTWVSAPINAGFFAYVVPPAHQTTTDALSSVVGLDANGNIIGQDNIGVTQPSDQNVLQTLPDGTKYALPRRAQASRAQELVNAHANGSHVYLWVMPRSGGGSCYLFGTGAGGGSGCWSPRELSQLPAVNGGLYGNNRLYFALVEPGIAALELNFQNGRSERLKPIDGVAAAAITSGNANAANARLVSVIALDQKGKVLSRQYLRP